MVTVDLYMLVGVFLKEGSSEDVRMNEECPAGPE